VKIIDNPTSAVRIDNIQTVAVLVFDLKVGSNPKIHNHAVPWKQSTNQVIKQDYKRGSGRKRIWSKTNLSG
jgi:hypothetical protein